MGIQAAGVTAEWAFGCDVACSNTAGFTAAIQTASAADVVVMVMGLDQGQERWDPGRYGSNWPHTLDCSNYVYGVMVMYIITFLCCVCVHF